MLSIIICYFVFLVSTECVLIIIHFSDSAEYAVPWFRDHEGSWLGHF